MKKFLLPGVKVEIRSSGLKNNEQCYISQIEEYINDTTIVLGTPIVGGQILPLKINKQYILIIYSIKGIYRCKIIAKYNFKRGLVELVKVEIISSFEKIQRREFFRYDCILPFKFNVNGSWYEGIIKDISGGGIRFITNSSLPPKNLITCKIPLENNDIEVNGLILIKEDSNIELYKYQYRVNFNEISKAEQEKIIQFIFNQQRKKVKQEKGL